MGKQSKAYTKYKINIKKGDGFNRYTQKWTTRKIGGYSDKHIEKVSNRIIAKGTYKGRVLTPMDIRYLKSKKFHKDMNRRGGGRIERHVLRKGELAFTKITGDKVSAKNITNIMFKDQFPSITGKRFASTITAKKQVGILQDKIRKEIIIQEKIKKGKVKVKGKGRYRLDYEVRKYLERKTKDKFKRYKVNPDTLSTKDIANTVWNNKFFYNQERELILEYNAARKANKNSKATKVLSRELKTRYSKFSDMFADNSLLEEMSVGGAKVVSTKKQYDEIVKMSKQNIQLYEKHKKELLELKKELTSLNPKTKEGLLSLQNRVKEINKVGKMITETSKKNIKNMRKTLEEVKKMKKWGF